MNGFKYKGRTFGMDDIFHAHEARNEKYSAFGKEKDFLSKIIGLGFLVQDGFAYHPAFWTPLDPKNRIGFDTHYFKTSKGTIRYGHARTFFGKK